MKNEILIIEDEAPLRQAAATALSEAGYSIREAINGQEGLEAIIEKEPDMILLDNIMPTMDGITMLQTLKDRGVELSCKIIVLTNVNDLETINKTLFGGATDYLIKSNTSLKNLVEIIDNYFQDKQPQTAI